LFVGRTLVAHTGGANRALQASLGDGEKENKEVDGWN